jgi:hypothetical protein
MFAHGTESTWQNPSNFTRLIVVLATIAAIESWYDESHRVSLFLPEMNEDSKLLWRQAQLQGNIQIYLKEVEEAHYHKHGRLVPELPTDDGVLLRKCLLSDDCMKDLVRPLREAGWSSEVTEPDERALYMTVIASRGETRFEVALLYSCASDNELYRKLAERCEAILYRGAPNNQEGYAYNIPVHVGPVLGWQPPLAPGYVRPHRWWEHLYRRWYEERFRKRAARANIDAALLVLDTLVPDVPPDPGDELPE